MASSRRPSRRAPRKAGRPTSPARRPLSVRRVRGDDAWELVHPRCAQERAEDLDEVRAMIEAGEHDLARDELRWLLEECHDLLAAHSLLGEIAAIEGDWKLARAHYGYAYDLGLKALPPEGLPGPLPCRLPANRAFHEAGHGLANALLELGRNDLARQVIEPLLRLDPADPLDVRSLKPRAEGLPIVQRYDETRH